MSLEQDAKGPMQFLKEVGVNPFGRKTYESTSVRYCDLDAAVAEIHQLVNETNEAQVLIWRGVPTTMFVGMTVEEWHHSKAGDTQVHTLMRE